MENEREFSQAATEDIFRRALRRQVRPGDSLTWCELSETAREMGISDEVLAAAVAEYEEKGELEAAREAWLARRRQRFLEHLRAYLIVNAACLILDLVISGGVWFYYVMIGWGIGLAFDASDTFWPKPSKVDREAQKLVRRQRHKNSGDGKRHIRVGGGKVIVETPDRRIEIG